ncbi:Guanylate cyclase soluble subunit beta-1 [Hypsibius exemplaris]|uniref:Guanylate cyclase soluble subunit beta-1 n=1 Tax=Hypsibius exemplaris TaxID=2072580 RepID=A0A1W0WZF5_HYPEX|nr:Guanylate cyclase soluble subunit beta-1 [Hypsibius exemplaris]
MVRKEAGVDMDGNFLIRFVYADEMTYRLVVAAEKILGVKVATVLELFGGFFYEFCIESGYDKILQVLGSTPTAFLENLDALHDHLASIYPGMRAPSFRCTKVDYKSTILHYYSERDGLEPIVLGIVKAVASKLHNREVTIKVHIAKSAEGPNPCDHTQFLIEEVDAEKFAIVEDLATTAKHVFKAEAKISPDTFVKLFPFHVIFDRQFIIRGVGSSLARVIPQLMPNASASPSSSAKKKCRLNDIFDMLRPHMNFDFKTIVNHIMTVFVLKTVDGLMVESKVTKKSERLNMKLKGQMVYLPDRDWVLYICSPSTSNLSDLRKSGCFLSDLPLHDATKDLVLMSEHFEEEYNLARDLEVLTDNLQQSYRELEEEKKKTDKLLYSILPPSVAIELRHNRPVPAKKYEHVTLMFCGVTSFAQFCLENENEPIKIVELLNRIYTRFDALTDPKLNPHVFKVETVGDKYMAVSGLPDANESHARWIAKLSLEMMEIAEQLKAEGQPVTITIGMHSGELVTGVIGHRMPRYCLFGNTVNLASRTESTGTKGSINVSEATFRFLQDEHNYDPTFHLDCRGKVHMKGKAEPMNVYVLERGYIDPRMAFLFHPLLKTTAV